MQHVSIHNRVWDFALDFVSLGDIGSSPEENSKMMIMMRRFRLPRDL